ncbi:protein-disulfide reductase DsbD family protein [Lentisphaera profundi]|uniref:Protein-disulfide reductase DsbD family protein n=1 Tax=Lentisphaera profundi TaxID=1658616 RepID=A0ABY7VNI0_9BACT|nr:protein-disulfide reductase DsbD domain-containing protein [Lentisphaera profundi]WDE95462.1 protein-disulfide reductase DsbD family protein [Lentisphaera profundi]
MLNKLITLIFLITSFSAFADKLVDAEIILPRSYAAPGQVRQIIIKVNVKKGWHTYWKNPGESGIAPDFTWHGDNYEIKNIHWPSPKYYENTGIVNYVYDGEILFIANLVIKPGTKDGQITIKADADFLVCKGNCVMQNLKLTSIITVDSKNRIETMQIHPLLSQAMDQLPRYPSKPALKQRGKKFSLTLPKKLNNKPAFFAFREDGVVSKKSSLKEGELTFESNEETELKGLLIFEDQSLIID